MGTPGPLRHEPIEKMMALDLKSVEGFIVKQLAEWPLAASNFEALKGVEVKEFDVDGMPIKVQFNPARIVSSGAKVDAASLKARKCFLCDENRPVEQFGIEWGDYTVLINPFPIFPRHLTIPDRRHTDQLIENRIADMFRLTRQLKGYTVFYNGPKCGASAPDHMHFQAGNSDFLTLGKALESADMEELAKIGDACLYAVDTLPLKMFVIDSADPEEGAKLFDVLYKAMEIKDGETEPMMNLLCYSAGDKERLVVIPRKKHRPSFYGTEGNDSMLLSPASVDMGGVFITPRREDFERFDENIVRKVYEELCLSSQELNEIAKKIRK